jgi:hypothetical protein
MRTNEAPRRGLPSPAPSTSAGWAGPIDPLQPVEPAEGAAPVAPAAGAGPGRVGTDGLRPEFSRRLRARLMHEAEARIGARRDVQAAG